MKFPYAKWNRSPPPPRLCVTLPFSSVTTTSWRCTDFLSRFALFFLPFGSILAAFRRKTGRATRRSLLSTIWLEERNGNVAMLLQSCSSMFFPSQERVEKTGRNGERGGDGTIRERCQSSLSRLEQTDRGDETF